MKLPNRQSPQATKLFDHVRELRTRLFVCLIVLAIAGTIVYFFYQPILVLLRSPLNSPLYYNSPSGSFAFVMKICFMGALTIAIPVIIYNLIMFVRPAFEKSLTMKRVYATSGLSIIMALAGAAFAFTCILPGTLNFFNGFQTSGLHALISADNYLNFVTNMIITFVIVFQIPLLIAFIDSVKPIPPKKMLGMEKWVVLGSLIVAALVPFAFDLVTCLLIALPIVVLYNLSIILVVIQHARSAHKIRTANHAVIIKPKTEDDFMKDLSMNFEEITTDLISQGQTVPIQTTKPKPTNADIRPLNYHPDTVKPAAWVEERRLRRLEINSKNRVFSDINHKQKPTNPALTSQ